MDPGSLGHPCLPSHIRRSGRVSSPSTASTLLASARLPISIARRIWSRFRGLGSRRVGLYAFSNTAPIREVSHDSQVRSRGGRRLLDGSRPHGNDLDHGLRRRRGRRGGGPPPPVGNPPTGLSYASPVVGDEAKVAITDNTPTVGGGAVTLWSGLAAARGPRDRHGDGRDLGDAERRHGAGDLHRQGGERGRLHDGERQSDGASQPRDNLAAKPRSPTTTSATSSTARTSGARHPEFDAVKAAGLPAYVDAMVEFADTTTLETEAFQFLRNTPTPRASRAGSRASHRSRGTGST